MRKQIKKNKLRYYRRVVDLTQTQLAEAVEFERINGQVYISKCERGILRTPERLKLKISSILGFPVAVVFPEGVGLAEREVLDEKTRNKTI